MNANGIIVRCEDGRIRHRERFGTIGEARQWAEWGHCCTVRHTFHNAGNGR